jgi:hypothetical protein
MSFSTVAQMIGLENDPAENEARILYIACIVSAFTGVTFTQRYFSELQERREFVKLWLEEKKNL